MRATDNLGSSYSTDQTEKSTASIFKIGLPITECNRGAAGLQQSTGVRGDGGGGLYVGSVSPGGHAGGEHGLVGRHRHSRVRYKHFPAR